MILTLRFIASCAVSDLGLLEEKLSLLTYEASFSLTAKTLIILSDFSGCVSERPADKSIALCL